jgi:hypothetical protein
MKNVYEFVQQNLLLIITSALIGLGLLAFLADSMKKPETSPSAPTPTCSTSLCGGVCCSDPPHPTGSTCGSSGCECPAATPDVCSNICVDQQSNDDYCGPSCANCLMSTNPTGFTCRNGTCMCQQGLDVCGGACVNKSTDNNNCGYCGTACNTANNENCANGVCV